MWLDTMAPTLNSSVMNHDPTQPHVERKVAYYYYYYYIVYCAGIMYDYNAQV